MAHDSDGLGSEQARLLASVAEQLKLPLLQIRHFAELGQHDPSTAELQVIQARATMAMTLVEHYLLSFELSRLQSALPLEPVSISSLLCDVLHVVEPTARQYAVPVELHIGGKYEPVMAHREGLTAALVSLGLACIESQPANEGSQPLRFTVHRSTNGITTGIYGLTDALAESHLRLGRILDGTAKQPLPHMTASSGAGIFVADSLLRAMHAELRVARHRLARGLGVTLQPSRQLQLV